MFVCVCLVVAVGALCGRGRVCGYVLEECPPWLSVCVCTRVCVCFFVPVRVLLYSTSPLGVNQVDGLPPASNHKLFNSKSDSQSTCEQPVAGLREE